MKAAISFRNWLFKNYKLTVTDSEFIENEEKYVAAYQRYRVNHYELMAEEYEDYNTLSFRMGVLVGVGIVVALWTFIAWVTPVIEGVRTW